MSPAAAASCVADEARRLANRLKPSNRTRLADRPPEYEYRGGSVSVVPVRKLEVLLREAEALVLTGGRNAPHALRSPAPALRPAARRCAMAGSTSGERRIPSAGLTS